MSQRNQDTRGLCLPSYTEHKLLFFFFSLYVLGREGGTRTFGNAYELVAPASAAIFWCQGAVNGDFWVPELQQRTGGQRS